MRMAAVFLAAVFVPSLFLGYLALRTAGDQRVLIEQQAVALYQNDTDILAASLDAGMLARVQDFSTRVRELLAQKSATELARSFNADVGNEWRRLGVGFAVLPGGDLPATEKANADFVRANAAFLTNRLEAEVYPSQNRSVSDAAEIEPTKDRKAEKLAAASNPFTKQRNVAPQQAVLDVKRAQISKVAPEMSDFQTATSQGGEGVLARFVRNELEVILWTRPPEGDGTVFGIAVDARALATWVREIFERVAIPTDGVCLAVLNDRASPVALRPPEFVGEWKRPFVATEIGDALPHWEVALYLLDPDQLARSARLVTSTILALIALALAAILSGGLLVGLDARRQMAQVRRKTDFVSNVSHELKTPLTSIRMFAELLRDGRVSDPEKRTQYLRIISLESERLTRLINNVLDFSRMDRGSVTRRRERIDFHAALVPIWEAQSEHLREAGFTVEWVAEEPPYWVRADVGALGQVVVNLLANAEKYGGEAKVVALRSWRADGDLRVAVSDRGIGINPGEERKIFEAFHRSDDSLASDVPGSGLGLTLAAGIAAEHHGRVEVTRRSGGGTTFTLILPLAGAEGEA